MYEDLGAVQCVVVNISNNSMQLVLLMAASTIVAGRKANLFFKQAREIIGVVVTQTC